MHKIIDLSEPDNKNIFIWKEFEETILSNREKDPKLGSKLYFMKDCKIPRTQLKDSFKRSIKKESCDYIVIPSKNRIMSKCSYSFRYIYEFKDVFYLLSTMSYTHEYSKKSLDFFNANNIPLPNINKLNSLGVYEHRILYDILELLNCNKKFVFEDDLLNVLQTIGEIPTEEDIYNIISLLESNDIETNKLAITIMCGWNISEIECTIKAILHKYHDKVKAIKSTCDIENIIKLVREQEPITSYLHSISRIDIKDYDKLLCKKIFLKEITEKFNNNLSYYRHLGNFSITIHEEDNSDIGT